MSLPGCTQGHSLVADRLDVSAHLQAVLLRLDDVGAGHEEESLLAASGDLRTHAEEDGQDEGPNKRRMVVTTRGSKPNDVAQQRRDGDRKPRPRPECLESHAGELMRRGASRALRETRPCSHPIAKNPSKNPTKPAASLCFHASPPPTMR